MFDHNLEKASSDPFLWPKSEWLIGIVICKFFSTANLKSSCGSPLFCIGSFKKGCWREWIAATQFVYRPMSHSEPSRSIKTLCDFQHWCQLANAQSFLQPLALKYFVDRRGICHQRYCLTSVAAQRFGSQWLWSFTECFSNLERLLGSPNHVFPHYHNTLR